MAIQTHTHNGKPRCQREGIPSAHSMRTHQCHRTASVDGKWCKTHDPKAIEARRAKQKSKSQAEQREWLHRQRGHDAISLLREIAKGRNDAREKAQEFIDAFDDKLTRML